MRELWKHIVDRLHDQVDIKSRISDLEVILSKGTLATRIMKSLNGDYSVSTLTNVYKTLAVCLAENKMFVP